MLKTSLLSSNHFNSFTQKTAAVLFIMMRLFVFVRFVSWCVFCWCGCVFVCAFSFQVVSVSSSDASVLKTDKLSDSRERDGLQGRSALSKQGESTHTHTHSRVCVCNILIVPTAHTSAHLHWPKKHRYTNYSTFIHPHVVPDWLYSFQKERNVEKPPFFFSITNCHTRDNYWNQSLSTEENPLWKKYTLAFF